MSTKRKAYLVGGGIGSLAVVEDKKLLKVVGVAEGMVAESVGWMARRWL